MGRKTNVIEDGAGNGGSGSTGQQIYAVLHEQIMSLQLAPNTELDEVQLAHEFGRSRTPVREALLRLAADDLVVIAPNRGARVAPLDIDRIPQILEALELYERITIRWAALRRTEAHIALMEQRNAAFIAAVRDSNVRGIVETNWAFHDVLNSACGNQFIAHDASKMLRGVMRLSMLAFSQPQRLPDGTDDIVVQHEGMIAAIRDGDADLAEQLAYRHSDGFRDRIRAFISGRSTADINLDPKF